MNKWILYEALKDKIEASKRKEHEHSLDGIYEDATGNIVGGK
jgi:hypothetical protein